jgi:hypothetical protein
LVSLRGETYDWSRFGSSLEHPREPCFETHRLLPAAIYFLVDAVFLSGAKPLSNWIAEHWIFESLRAWIVSLRPYPTLPLFAVPLIVLEPVKPAAAYLVGTGHFAMGMIVLVVGEILKLVLVERLFSVSRDKLMSIPVFASAYWKYRALRI